jgi:hypothetical protein
MRVLVGCEESQTITAKYRAKGIEAYSCDIKPAKINHAWHYQRDIFDVINLGWDLAIFHPPCTFLTVTANKWMKPEFEERFPTRKQDRLDAIEFFMKLWNCDISRIAIENPIGIMSTVFRKPDQIIQPWHFGDSTTKSTCLWIRNLPKLKHSAVDNLFEQKTHVKPEFIIGKRDGKKYSKIHYQSITKIPGERSEIRSKTFDGIAQAIVDQWLF